jgi:hypothetical protein
MKSRKKYNKPQLELDLLPTLPKDIQRSIGGRALSSNHALQMNSSPLLIPFKSDPNQQNNIRRELETLELGHSSYSGF